MYKIFFQNPNHRKPNLNNRTSQPMLNSSTIIVYFLNFFPFLLTPPLSLLNFLYNFKILEYSRFLLFLFKQYSVLIQGYSVLIHFSLLFFWHKVLCFFDIRVVAKKALFKHLVSLPAIEAIIFSHLPRFIFYIPAIKIEHLTSTFRTLHFFILLFLSFSLIFFQYFISLCKISTPFLDSRNSTEASWLLWRFEQWILLLSHRLLLDGWEPW